MKKKKILKSAILSTAILGLTAATVYGASSSHTIFQDLEPNNNENTHDHDHGSLASPAIVEVSPQTSTNLNGVIRTYQPYVNIIEGSQITKHTTGSSSEIKPMVRITWPDTTIKYNTTMRFVKAGGEPWLIRKGVDAWFRFSMDDNEHVEVGFMDKNGTKLKILKDEKIGGMGTYYTPTRDVEGYFYIQNKAAGAITVRNVWMEY